MVAIKANWSISKTIGLLFKGDNLKSVLNGPEYKMDTVINILQCGSIANMDMPSMMSSIGF